MEGPVVVSFSLFSSNPSKYEYYRDAALATLPAFARTMKTVSFVAHLHGVPPEDAAALVTAGGGPTRVTVHMYNFSAKRGVHWLAGALRFRTLWEHNGPEPVVVVDIHDDVKLQCAQLKKLWMKLTEANAQLGATFWRSDEAECVSHVGLPTPQHAHTDGGLLVWRSGPLRTLAALGPSLDNLLRPASPLRPLGKRRSPRVEALNTASPMDRLPSWAAMGVMGMETVRRQRGASLFTAFVSHAAQAMAVVPRGADEMLLDAYLKLCGVYTTHGPAASQVVFLQHRHRMMSAPPPAPSPPPATAGAGTTFTAPAAIDVPTGTWAADDMYVCSERNPVSKPNKRRRAATPSTTESKERLPPLAPA